MKSSLNTYPEQESKTLEFKSQVPAFSTLIKTCVAFANTAGGSIIIGIEDASRKIIGISEADRERIYYDFPNSLYDTTVPGLFAHIYEKSLNNKTVLMIEIPFSAKKPVYIKKEGIPKGVYIRVGASNRRAQDAHIADLMREGKHDYYDEEPTKATLDDLSNTLLSKCYGKNYTKKRLLSDFVITSSINIKKHYATIAGTLMFSENPEKYIPEALILCTQFSGTKGRDIIQTRQLTGPISQLIDDSLKILGNWLAKDLKLNEAKLVGKLPVPKAALREAIANALLHRKYTIPGAVKIALYDDRLEIFSPGAFPGLVDTKNLGDGTTCLRNPHLTQIARRLHLIEKLGTGIRLIFDECEKLGIKKPQYQEDGDYVKIIFYFSPSTTGKKTDEEAIMALLEMRKSITAADVVMLLNISRNTATRKLNNLIKQNLIKRHGKGPGVQYTK